MGSGKGSAFERSICKQLSAWWTHGERDDVFWRSQASGARATVRSRKQQSTQGQYGDIAATDPIGHALIARITFELKRGYKLASPYDSLDSKTTATTPFTAFVKQAALAAANAETPAWALITQRDRREAIITMPSSFFAVLAKKCATKGVDANYDMGTLLCGEHCPVCEFHGRVAGVKRRLATLSMRLPDWLHLITPENIKALD